MTLLSRRPAKSKSQGTFRESFNLGLNEVRKRNVLSRNPRLTGTNTFRIPERVSRSGRRYLVANGCNLLRPGTILHLVPSAISSRRLTITNMCRFYTTKCLPRCTIGTLISTKPYSREDSRNPSGPSPANFTATRHLSSEEKSPRRKQLANPKQRRPALNFLTSQGTQTSCTSSIRILSETALRPLTRRPGGTSAKSKAKKQ